MGFKLKVKVAMVVLVLVLVLPGISHALTHDQKALVGLKGVGVLVKKIDPEPERLGLTRDQIQTDVELRFRKAGIRVLTEKEWKKTPGMPRLLVQVDTIIISGSARCVFHTSVETSAKVL